MPVKIIRTWETIEFYGPSKDGTAEAHISLTLNHQQKTYELSSPSQDNLVELRGDDIAVFELHLDLIKSALKYTKDNL